MMAMDYWANEVATLATAFTRQGPDFTLAEKRHWVARLDEAATKDEEAARA